MGKKYFWFFIFFFQITALFSQNPWVKKANFPGAARAWTSEFTIGHYAFVGLGSNNGNYFYDFWKWNETTNTWSAIPNYPGAGDYDATAFTIEGKGYVGLGENAFSAVSNDLWRFDTLTNKWTQMASLPGVARYDCQAFVIGHKAYFVAGSGGGPPYYQDVWVYDAHTNSWTQKSNWPGGLVEETICFAIGKHGYVGDGWYPGCNVQMFRYDTATDKWTAIATVPQANGITEQPDSWVSGSKAYLCTGADCNAAGLRNGWMYDTVTNSWCEFNRITVAKLSRGNGVAFTINNKGYFCTGQDTNLNFLGDLWEYSPSTKINVSDTNLCANDSVHFSDSSSYIASGWSWTFPGGSPVTSNLKNPAVYYSTSGTYTATLIITACGGGDTVKKTTVVKGGLSGIKIKGKTPLCLGSSDTITASGGGNYLWSNGATTSSIIVKPLVTTNYSVHVSNGGCLGDTSITITVDHPFIAGISGQDTICEGMLDTLTAIGGGTYKWSTGATTNSIVVNSISIGNYYVVVSNGCIDTVSKTIAIAANPVLYACCDTIISSGMPIVLNASGTIRYQWLPSLGVSCDTCPNPTVVPTTTTTYTVIGTDSAGCSIEKIITVDVLGCFVGSIPNVITPNGDGKNDEFYIHIQSVLGYSISIYDRWGKEIYQSNNPNEYWNGKNQNDNSLVSDGVYYYIIKYTCNNKSYKKDGYVQVIR